MFVETIFAHLVLVNLEKDAEIVLDRALPHEVAEQLHEQTGFPIVMGITKKLSKSVSVKYVPELEGSKFRAMHKVAAEIDMVFDTNSGSFGFRDKAFPAVYPELPMKGSVQDIPPVKYVDSIQDAGDSIEIKGRRTAYIMVKDLKKFYPEDTFHWFLENSHLALSFEKVPKSQLLQMVAKATCGVYRLDPETKVEKVLVDHKKLKEMWANKCFPMNPHADDTSEYAVVSQKRLLSQRRLILDLSRTDIEALLEKPKVWVTRNVPVTDPQFQETAYFFQYFATVPNPKSQFGVQDMELVKGLYDMVDFRKPVRLAYYLTQSPDFGFGTSDENTFVPF